MTAFPRFTMCLAALTLGVPGQVYTVHSNSGPPGASGFGAAAAVLEDLDGDGAREYAVGAPSATGGGAVFVHSGGNGGLLFALRSFETFPAVLPERFGAILAAGPSLAGGLLAIGDPLSGEPFSPFTQAADTGALHLSRLTPRRAVNGTSTGAGFGSSMACIGDVDGDRCLEFLVGSPLASGGLVHGRASVVSGLTGQVIRTHSTIAVTGERFGAAVAGLGDINGDAVPDYAIADPLADVLVAGADAGQVRIFSGANGEQILLLSGTTAGERFGSSITGTGQFVFGPSPEFGMAVGSPNATVGGAANAGKVSMIRLPSGTVEAVFGGGIYGGANARFGTTLTATNPTAVLVGTPGAGTGPLGGTGRLVSINFSSGAINLTINNPGSGIQDEFGAAIAFGGAFPGGLFSNIVIGAPRFGTSDHGAVYLFSGTGALLRTHIGNVAGGRLGTSIAIAGDLNGDGFSDVAAGGPAASGGAVEVFSSATGALLQMNLSLGTSQTGASMAPLAAPFTANTGFGFAFGAPGTDLPGLPGAGRIEISAGATLGTCTPSVAGDDGAHLGSSVAILGDLDGDGAPEIAAGAPGHGSGGLADRGRVAVFSSASRTEISSLLGAAADDALGSAVAPAGDVNGDGVPDLSVGIPGADGALAFQANAGRVSWFSGAGHALIRSSLGSSANEGSGRTLALLGDVNGDGIADVAAGSPLFSPVQNPGAGRVRILSGATALVLRTITGPEAGAGFGSSLAGAGDQDGDGVQDVLAGSPFSDVPPAGTADRGKAEVFSGATGALLATLLGPASPNVHFGAAAAAGDVTADCVPDLLAGAPESASGQLRVLTRFGLGAGVSRFFSGCPGAGGLTPFLSTFGGNPTAAGNPGFGLAISCAAGGAPVWLLVGLSQAAWNGFSLPLDLGFAGLSGCSLLVSADLLIPGAAGGGGPGGGLAVFPIPLPADPALSNLVVFAQGLVLDPGAPNGAGAMTGGLVVSFTAPVP